MAHHLRFAGRILAVAAGFLSLSPLSTALAQYHPITPTMENATVTLNSRDLTVDKVMQVARFGAKVRIDPALIERIKDQRGLRVQATQENVPVYGLNRGAGARREQKKSVGTPETTVPPWINNGVMPEVMDEDLVRAIMTIMINAGSYAGPTPEFVQMVAELLNKRVTPVFYSRGMLGDGDLPLLNSIQSTMNGRGDAYYRGVRMHASEALKKAGLKPMKTEGQGAGGNAYGDSLATFMVYDGRLVLEWADLANALDRLAMNSSVTPLATPARTKRPFKWVNWDAARTLDMLKGSYLFQEDPKRILQDPEGLRASHIRQGSAWKAWAALRDAVNIQINGSESNGLAIVGGKPEDSWEMSTPFLMQFYVKGGPASNGKSGYILSNANWDPYPMANMMEAFTNALSNAAAAVAMRIERFTDRDASKFFVGVLPPEVMSEDEIYKAPFLSEPFFVFMDVWAELQNAARSVTPEGQASDLGVSDSQAFTRIKGENGRRVIDLTYQLLAYDVWNASNWINIRKAQDPSRNFGEVPTAAWTAFRKVIPWQQDPYTRPELPYGIVAHQFLKATPASTFYPNGPAMPETN